MMLHSDPLFSISFGDKEQAFDPKKFKNLSTGTKLLEQQQFLAARKIMQLETLIAPEQTHGTNGLIIKHPEDLIHYKPYQKEADFVVTNLSNIGIGVATADCLPIVFYDSSTHTIAIAHAGWQGSVNGIAIKTLKTMQEEFNVHPEYLKIFFGPCAKVNAYQVGSEFTHNLQNCEFHDEVLVKKNGSYHFNLPLYNQRLLEQVGIKKEAFKLDYNLCTISNDSFCSYRRDGEKALRQMTIATLR